MDAHCLLRLIIVLALARGIAPSRATGAVKELTLPSDHPLYALFRPDTPTRTPENLEGHMITVSMIVALLALSVVVAAFVWCQRLHESVTHLRMRVSDADPGDRLMELANESRMLQERMDSLARSWQANLAGLESTTHRLENGIAELERRVNGLDAEAADAKERRMELAKQSQSLHERLDDLGQGRQADTARLEALIRQMENRIIAVEQACRNVGTLSQDLDRLRSFRDRVERIHAGIQKAFNGSLAGVSSALFQDGRLPPADGSDS